MYLFNNHPGVRQMVRDSIDYDLSDIIGFAARHIFPFSSIADAFTRNLSDTFEHVTSSPQLLTQPAPPLVTFWNDVSRITFHRFSKLKVEYLSLDQKLPGAFLTDLIVEAKGLAPSKYVRQLEEAQRLLFETQHSPEFPPALLGRFS